MRHLSFTLIAALALLAGCQSTGSSPKQIVSTSEIFRTVADTGTTQPGTSEKQTPTTVPTQARYTAPRAQFQGVNLIATALGATTMGKTSAGKEAAEASPTGGSNLTGITGAPGLGTPQARTVEAIVSQPGLQRGFAVGFGLMPSQNIFTRTFNPITGPNGGCQALVRAGFFASPAACQTQIRR